VNIFAIEAAFELLEQVTHTEQHIFSRIFGLSLSACRRSLSRIRAPIFESLCSNKPNDNQDNQDIQISTQAGGSMSSKLRPEIENDLRQQMVHVLLLFVQVFVSPIKV
jgi:hypothetical protein